MSLALVVVLLSQFTPPPMVDGASGEQVVVGRQAPLETRRLWELSVPGAIGAQVSWVIGLIYWFDSVQCTSWLASCRSASGFLWLPLVGPWLALMDASTTPEHLGPTVGLGIAQLAGLAAMMAGLFINVPTGEAVSLNLHPTGNGLALGGRF